MKRILQGLRHFELPRAGATKNILLIVSFFLIFDVLAVVFGASYLAENTGVFWGKSRTVILSDLLFLEGGIVFAIGAFFIVAEAIQEPLPNSETEETADARLTNNNRINLGVLMLIIGAILIGLAMMVGTLFP